MERQPPSRRETLKAITAAVKKYRESDLWQERAYIAHLCGRLDWTLQQALDWGDREKSG